MAEGLAVRLLADDAPEALKDAEIFALDTAGLLAGTRFRGDFEERFKAVIKALSSRPQRDSVHRRDSLDGRRRRHHRRHDGPGDADQADADRRRTARHRLDDLRRVQAHREGPRAGATAAEDRDRGAVDRRGDQDSRRAEEPLRRASPRHLHRRRARSGREAGGAAPARLQAARQRDRSDRRSRLGGAPRGAARQLRSDPAASRPSRRSRPGGRRRRGHRANRRAHRADPGAAGLVVGSRAAAHARGVAAARRVRPGRRGASRRAGDQAIARRARPARSSGRLLPVHRPDRRRQDRARQAAGASSSATSSRAST